MGCGEDYVLVCQIFGSLGASMYWIARFSVPWLLLAGAGVHFSATGHPGCVEDFVVLGEI